MNKIKLALNELKKPLTINQNMINKELKDLNDKYHYDKTTNNLKEVSLNDLYDKPLIGVYQFNNKIDVVLFDWELYYLDNGFIYLGQVEDFLT
jgi:hypothetical protein